MFTRLYAAMILPLILVALSIPGRAVEPGTGFHVIKYELTLSPDMASKTVMGTETILVQSKTSDLQQIVFSGNALTVDDAKLDGKAVRVSKDHGVLSFGLPETLGREEQLRSALSITVRHKTALHSRRSLFTRVMTHVAG